jgi:hypothetical protein
VRHLRRLLAGLALVGLLGFAPAAHAGDIYQTYNLAWSGTSFENDATATGQTTLDLTTLPNPGGPVADIYGDIQSLTVTVAGAGAGNGTWTLADLVPTSDLGTYTYWWTGGVALNMYTELVGQPTNGAPWGTPNLSSGDFNLFFDNNGPIGVFPFTLETAGGDGDQLLLTEFDPVTTPEPGSVLLLATGLIGILGAYRRKSNC